MSWAVEALFRRLVTFGIGNPRGQYTVELAIDSADGRRAAHMTPEQARRVAQRLNDLAFHVEQIGREA
jgi:hypothetical protein